MRFALLELTRYNGPRAATTSPVTWIERVERWLSLERNWKRPVRVIYALILKTRHLEYPFLLSEFAFGVERVL